MKIFRDTTKNQSVDYMSMSRLDLIEELRVNLFDHGIAPLDLSVALMANCMDVEALTQQIRRDELEAVSHCI